MAFSRWSGDDRLPSAAADTYFTAQALRAGYAVDHVARPDLAAPPPFSTREVLQREMQKERSREEYFSRELAHCRLLLDQQMRHQQELEAARRVVPSPAYLPLVPEFRAVESLSVVAPHPAELGFRESLRPPVPGFVDAGIHWQHPEPRSKSSVRGRPSAALHPKAVIRKQRPIGRGAAREHEVEQESLYCDVCKVRCTSQTMLNSHLNGKRHKEASATLPTKETCTSKEVFAPLPVKEQQQANQKKQVVQKNSLNCVVCNLKCNSELMLNAHLNGKKHKAQLMQRNKSQGDKPVSVEDSKHPNDKQHGKAQDGEPVTAESPKLANGKPVTAEENILAKNEPVVSKQSGKDTSLVTIGSSGQDGKTVTPEESGKALVPVTATGNVAVEEPVTKGPADTEVSVVGSVAAETRKSDQ